VLTALLLSSSTSAAAPQLEVDEAVEVRVVSVEVRAEGPDGEPIQGLRVDDFELRVDGEPVPIEYFTELEAPAAVAGKAAAEGAPSPTEPYLALLYDARSFRGRESRRTLESVRERLPVLLDSCRGVLVARLDGSIEIEQPFTSDPERLETALRELERPSSFGVRGNPGVLLREIEEAPDLGATVTASDKVSVEGKARSLLGEIRAQAQLESLEARKKVDDMGRFVERFAALPGRRVVLFLGSGPQGRPAERLYRMWWRKYSILAGKLQAGTIQSEIASTGVEDGLVRLIRSANRLGVSFYAFDPTGSRAAGGLVEFGTMEGAELTGDEQRTGQLGLLALADGTGGRGSVRAAGLEPLLDDMLADFSTYYSLGFEPPSEEGRIQLTLTRVDGRLRYLDRYTAVSDEIALRNAALTALMTGRLRNPLEATIEVGRFERRPDGTYVVPFLVKVPVARLALTPSSDRHLGSLSVVAFSEDATGDLSLPTFGHAPVDIANAELLEAMGAVTGHRLFLLLPEGEQLVTIGLRDDIARQLSTLTVSLDLESGS
jgi:VWFA-related protein